jgi:hypothetical protein
MQSVSTMTPVHTVATMTSAHAGCQVRSQRAIKTNERAQTAMFAHVRALRAPKNGGKVWSLVHNEISPSCMILGVNGDYFLKQH